MSKKTNQEPIAADAEADLFLNIDTGTADLKITDRSFWLDVSAVEGVWIRALEVVDETLDTTGLSQLLRSEIDLSPTSRRFLADLLDRHQLKRRRGGQGVADYNRSDADIMLELADEEVRQLVSQGTSVSAALEKVSLSRSILVEVLDNFYKKRRGSTERARRRRARP